MKFGDKVKDAPQDVVSNGDGGGKFIKYFPDGETQVHFLEELDEWTVYWDHFHQSKQRSFPCTGNKTTCPGCTSENEREIKASKKYLVNTLKDGYVDLYKIPVSIWDDLNRFSDKDGGTILARDYTIVRYGKGTDTKYSVDREDKVQVNVNLHKDKMQDHQVALNSAYVSVWGPPEEESPINQDPPKKTRAKKTVPAQRGEIPGEFDQDPPSEPEQEKIEPVQEEIEITEDQLRNMSEDELIKIYQMCGIEPPAALENNHEALTNYLISQLG